MTVPRKKQLTLTLKIDPKTKRKYITIGKKKYWVKNSVTKRQLGKFVNSKLKQFGFKTGKIQYRQKAKPASFRGPPTPQRGLPTPTRKEQAAEIAIEQLQRRREPENIELFQMSKEVLMELAKQAEIKGRSSMTKAQLITAIKGFSDVLDATKAEDARRAVEEAKKAVMERKQLEEKKLEKELAGKEPETRAELIKTINERVKVFREELPSEVIGNRLNFLPTSSKIRGMNKRALENLHIRLFNLEADILDEEKETEDAEFKKFVDKKAKDRALNALKSNLQDSRQKQKTQIIGNQLAVLEDKKTERKVLEQMKNLARIRALREASEARRPIYTAERKTGPLASEENRQKASLQLARVLEKKEALKEREKQLDQKAGLIKKKYDDSLKKQAFEVLKDDFKIKNDLSNYKKIFEVFRKSFSKIDYLDPSFDRNVSKLLNLYDTAVEKLNIDPSLEGKISEFTESMVNEIQTNREKAVEDFNKLTSLRKAKLDLISELNGMQAKARMGRVKNPNIDTDIEINDSLPLEKLQKIKEAWNKGTLSAPKPANINIGMPIKPPPKQFSPDITKPAIPAKPTPERGKAGPKAGPKPTEASKPAKPAKAGPKAGQKKSPGRTARVPNRGSAEPAPKPAEPVPAPPVMDTPTVLTSEPSPPVMETPTIADTGEAASGVMASTPIQRQGIPVERKTRWGPPTAAPVMEPEDEDMDTSEGKGHNLPVGKGISNHDIDNFLSKFGHEYLGCIACDEVSSKIYPKIIPRSRGFFVMNTDPSYKSGLHWVCVFMDARPHGSSSIEYFDSFADPMPTRLQEDIKGIAERLDAKTYLKLKENRIKFQCESSDNCGHFCMEFICDRMRGKPFPEASKFNDSVRGEDEVNRWKTQNGFGFLPSFGQIINTIRPQVPSVVKNAWSNARRAVGEKADQLRQQFFPAKKLPAPVQVLFDKFKNNKVISAQVRREPIFAIIDKVINLISGGKFDEAKRDQGYDKMFHLSLILTLDNGQKLLTEKNERINLTTSWKDTDKVEYFNVGPIMSSPTLEQFFGNTEKAVGDHRFFTYNAFDQNCQRFIADLLQSNNSLSNNAQNFILQDAQSIVKKMPFFVSKIAQFATDTAGRVKQFFGLGSAKASSKKQLRKQRFRNFMNKIKSHH